MNDQMKQEMERTILLLQGSMPKPKSSRTSIFLLLRIAASEMNLLLLLVLFAGTLGLGAAATRFISLPMLTSFCTAPLPLLLLFHRYVFNRNESMRELEETFPYSYAEMLIARTIVISLYTFVFLLSLAATLHYSIGESFLRLALCGIVPNVYLCALLLFLSCNFRNQESISVFSIIFWAALCFLEFLLPFNDILLLCSTGIYAAVSAVGLVLYGVCLYQIKTRRIGYALTIG